MDEMKKFWMLLDGTFPHVQACWDRQNGVLKTERMEHLLSVASSGEKHMAKFLRDV